MKGRKHIPDIVKSERFMNRPDLRDLFRAGVLRDKRKRNERMAKAVMEYGYTQRAVADHLRMHFTSVSRILRTEEKMPTK